ncbi:TetR/AcrR family transcriptional regulator [Paenibacillus pasadenensis]|uniref:TetR/AcrR family transcriptional regulator n=1 Tax=Paenibacillus pasadenensis TaxID=217090 RepID=UPI0020401085|nr:TetR/AcrR family transcriptional regulator [Paenibacillus pasadenensis]MCM3748392.1 TetR/AcrR family transcriptional regulator [Paenibacillus pasadenensis]
MSIDRRAEVVQAAAKSFAMFGYKATTMDQVARIARVAKGTIYTFFDNKEQLFEEIMKDFVQEILQLAENAIDPDKPFAENLHRALIDVLNYRKEHELFSRLTMEMKEIGTAAAGFGISMMEEALLGFVANAVQDAIAKGEIKPCDPKLTAYVLVKLFITLVVDWPALSGEPFKEEDVMRLFELYLLDGISQR